MDEADPLRKYVEAGIAFTQLTKARAEAIVRELVKAGEVQREQAQDRVEELLDRSRKSSDGLVGLVRREIEKQLSSMGFATRGEVDELEARIEARLTATQAGTAAPASKPSPPPTPAKTAVAPKPAAKAAKASGAPGPAAKAARAPATASRSERATATPPAGSAASSAAASPRRKPAAPGDRA